MKVEDLRKISSKTWFFALNEGEVFLYDTGFYVKISKESYFCFQRGVIIHENRNFEVTKVQAKLVIES